MPLYTTRDTFAQYNFQVTDNSLIGASIPIGLAQDTATMSTAGRLEIVRIKVPYPASVTNLIIKVSTAGSVLTSGQCKAAFYTSAGVLIGVTADQSGTWNSTGFKTMALASGPFSVAAGEYYAGLWYNGTTGPTLARGGANNAAFVGNINRSAPDYLAATSSTSLTTTAPDPFGAQAIVSGSLWWFGLS